MPCSEGLWLDACAVWVLPAQSNLAVHVAAKKVIGEWISYVTERCGKRPNVGF